MLETVRSVARVVKHSRIFEPSRQPANSGLCFVFGNGPSLSKDIEGYLDALREIDNCCVNQFCESPIYSQVQPSIYILADPDYWIDQVSPDLQEMRARLIDNILEKTVWNLKLYVPYQAVKFFSSAFLSKNFIEVIGYNNVPLSGKTSVLHFLFDRGWGSPPAQNVLIAALFILIRLKYKKIVLLGADHSWHETLVLDGNNRVCIKNSHFYNQNAQLSPWTMGGKEDRIYTMGSIFHALSKMFNGYCEIRKYAEHCGTEILNAGSLSYVDAFDRTTISEVIESIE